MLQEMNFYYRRLFLLRPLLVDYYHLVEEVDLLVRL
jgi:hypothetical protein